MQDQSGDFRERLARVEADLKRLIEDRIESTQSRAKMVDDLNDLNIDMAEIKIQLPLVQKQVNTNGKIAQSVADSMQRMELKVEKGQRISPRTLITAVSAIGAFTGVVVFLVEKVI